MKKHYMLKLSKKERSLRMSALARKRYAPMSTKARKAHSLMMLKARWNK